MAGGGGPEGLTPDGEALIAGILEHLPRLMAVVAPSVVSYARLQPHRFAAPFACWGRENREAALRLIRGTVGTSERAANVELKAVDGTSNPYLSAAVVIAAALDGLAQRRKLPPPVSLDPSELIDIVGEGQVKPLPADLGEAIALSEQSTVVRDALGTPLFDAFLAVRRLESEALGAAEAADAIAAHRFRYG